jgi:glycosyltransferase involved in cell wall biosynthesis
MAARGTETVVVVLTFNSATVIEATIRAALTVSPHVLVVDSGSTDGTVELATKLGCRVTHRSFKNYSDQRNWAIANVGEGFAWQLHIDADEILDDAAVRAVLTSVRDPGDARGFLIRRRTYFMGRPLRFGGTTTWHLRLFRTGSGRCEDRLYDQHFKCEGKVGRLAGYLDDMNVGTLAEWTAKHNRWTDMEAEELARAHTAANQIGSRLFGTDPRQRRRFYKNLYYRSPLVIRPFVHFSIRYFVQLGFLDGRLGLLYAVLQALWFRMLVDAKLMERTMAGPSGHQRHHEGKGRESPSPPAPQEA